MKPALSITLFILFVVGCEVGNWAFFHLNPIIKTNLALSAVNGNMMDAATARAYSENAEALVRFALFVVYSAALILVVNKTKLKNEKD
jgi:hypothetical protein